MFGSTVFTVAGISALVQIGGPAAVDGTYFATVPFAVRDNVPPEDPRYKTIAQFREAFKAKYNNYPDLSQWWIAQNYDIGMLLAEAIKRAGPNVTGATLKTALEGIQDYQGVLGVSFNFSPERHSGGGGVVVGQIKDGKDALESDVDPINRRTESHQEIWRRHGAGQGQCLDRGAADLRSDRS